MPTRIRERRLWLPTGLPADFNPLTQVSGILHGVWASDPLWANPGDGGSVASWRNQSGGGDPAQAVALLQPLWRQAGINGRPSVEFDGINDVLDVNITDQAQPFKVLAVAQLTSVPAAGRILGGSTSNTRGLGTSVSQWAYNYGTGQVGGTANTQPHVFRATINNTSSAMAVDGAVTVTGSSSSAAFVRFVIGAGSDATPTFATYWPGHIAYVGVFPNATADADLVALETYLRLFYATA